MNKKIEKEIELANIIFLENSLSNNKNQFYCWILKMMNIKKEDLLLNLAIKKQIIKEEIKKINL